jgi:hypothetical protein
MLGGAVSRMWIAALVGVAVVGGVACGGDDDEESTESTDPTASNTTAAPTTTLNEESRKEEAAKDAFLDYYEAFFAAAAEPVTPQLPELQRLMTEDQQRIVTRNLEDMRARGHATRLPPDSQRRHDPRVVTLQADGSVDVTSCEVDDSIVYEVDTGAVINDDVVTNVISATLVEDRGQWKVAFSERTETSPGIVECAI